MKAQFKNFTYKLFTFESFYQAILNQRLDESTFIWKTITKWIYNVNIY